jgi:aminoglycoside phosphotransferase (APT) family kinase protein
MATPREDEQFEQVALKIEPQGRLLRRWELKGGVSAQVTVLEIERPEGIIKKVVVRRHGEADLEQNPHIAADEFKLLTIVRAAGIPAPTPCFFDQSGTILRTPYIVLEYVEGETDFAPADLDDFVRHFTTQLARIHKVDGASPDISFLPNLEDSYAEKFKFRPEKLDESLDEGRIRDVLEAAWPLPRRNDPVLLHGDYWPGNILWKDGRIAAIIDWEDARLGDPLADLGNSRLEVLWAFGIDAMNSFDYHYKSQAAIDYSNLPYWDLCAALRPAFKIAEWAGDEATEQRMRERHKLFVTQAFEQLAFSRSG